MRRGERTGKLKRKICKTGDKSTGDGPYAKEQGVESAARILGLDLEKDQITGSPWSKGEAPQKISNAKARYKRPALTGL